MEVIGAGPHTSLWTSSKGLEATKSDLLKGNWCILPLRQCLQWLSKSKTVLLQTSRKEREESNALLSTLLLGWPSLWCHSNHLCDFCTLKDAEYELCCCEEGLNYVEEVEGGRVLLKSFG